MSDERLIGIIGAGQMGRGIAQTAAQSDYRVLLSDMDLKSAVMGKERIASDLDRLIDKERITTEVKEQILEKITPVTGIGDVVGASFIVEAVSENEDMKRSIFRELDSAVGDDTILASNTSSISITRIAAATSKPERVIGMHFMNPVVVMKLVEVIRGVTTSDETYERTLALSRELNKLVVTSADYPGFIVNRILMPMINEAAFALMEGVATAEDIDLAMKLGTNQPMGPLTLADFIGLDTCLWILNVLHCDLGDSKYRACPLLKRYVDAGWLGRKVGRGFHSYSK